MRVLQISTYILKEVKSNVEKFYHILAKKCATESCNYVRITAALFLLFSDGEKRVRQEKEGGF